MLPRLPLSWIFGAAAVMAAAAWWLSRQGPGSAASNIGAAAGAAAVDAAAGLVLGAGDAVGIPRTNPTECELALAEGRVWDASFACPAGDFLSGAWGAITGPAEPANTGSVTGSW